MPDGVMGYTLQGGGDIAKLVGPFSNVLKGVVRDPFILNWLDLLSFLLSGSPTPSDPCFMWDPTLKRFQTFCGHIVTQEEVASDSLLLPGLPAGWDDCGGGGLHVQRVVQTGLMPGVPSRRQPGHRAGAGQVTALAAGMLRT